MSEIEFIPNEITIEEMVDIPPAPDSILDDKPKRNATRKGMKYKPRKPKESPSVSFEQPITASETVQQPSSPIQEEKKDDEKDLENTISEIKPNSEEVKLNQQQKVYITGRMFLFMLNIVAPFTFSSLWNMFNKKEKVKSEDIKLTQEELSEVEELADEVTKEIIGTLSPMTQMMMYLGICYGAKLMFAKKYSPDQLRTSE